MATVLVLYGSSYGQTALIARNLASEMRARGAEVIVYDVAALPRTLDVSRYDAVVLGGRVHGGKHPKKLVHFVRNNLAALQGMPSAFFSVSLAVRKDPKEAEEAVARFVAGTGWRPQLTATFAGALKYTKYDFFLRCDHEAHRPPRGQPHRHLARLRIHRLERRPPVRRHNRRRGPALGPPASLLDGRSPARLMQRVRRVRIVFGTPAP